MDFKDEIDFITEKAKPQEEVGLAHALRLHEFSLEGVENAVGIGGDEAAIAETLP